MSKEIIKSNRKKRGKVVSNKMTGTVVVSVSRTMPHPKYEKIVTRNKKYYAHCKKHHELGDTVTIIETKPISKLKRWRVEEVSSANS